MDLILGHSNEGDLPRNRADCGLHSLPMDGSGSDLHLAVWKSRDVRLTQRPFAPVGRQTILHSTILARNQLVKVIKRCAAECDVRFEPMCSSTGSFATSTRVLPCGLGCGQVIDLRWCSLLFSLLRCDNS